MENKQTAVMQLINFILVERRQDDGSIKFHAHEDFSRFLKMEKEQIITSHLDGFADAYDWPSKRSGEEYYNEKYGKKTH